MIIELLENHDKDSDPEDLVARASFLTNICHGSKVLSSFQLAMGYSPSILGIPRIQVPEELEELFKAHISLTANRAIQKLMKHRKSRLLNQSILTTGTRVYMYHKSSRHDEPVKWEEATVEKAEDHLVRCKRYSTGRVSLVAYEDIRLKPDDDLAKKLLYTSLQDEVTDERLHNPTDAEETNDNDTEDPTDDDNNTLPTLSDTDTSDEEYQVYTPQPPIHISPKTGVMHSNSRNNKMSYRTGMTGFIGGLNDYNNTGSRSDGLEYSEMELATNFSNGLKTDNKDIQKKSVRFEDLSNSANINVNADINPRERKKRKTDNWKSSILSSNKRYSSNIDIGENHHGRRKDVGNPEEIVLNPSGSHLMSSRQYELDTIYQDIRNTQVTRSKLQYAPDWLLDEALRK